MKNIDTIILELTAGAIRKGICEEWEVMMSHAKDLDTLVQMYVKGIDFCINNNFPSVSYMENNFKGMSEKYGVYINTKVNLTNIQKAVFVGDTSGLLRYDNYEVASLYVKNRARVEITVTDHAIVMLDCFEDSFVKLSAEDGAKITVNVYGRAKVSYSSDELSTIKINRMGKENYL